MYYGTKQVKLFPSTCQVIMNCFSNNWGFTVDQHYGQELCICAMTHCAAWVWVPEGRAYRWGHRAESEGWGAASSGTCQGNWLPRSSPTRTGRSIPIHIGMVNKTFPDAASGQHTNGLVQERRNSSAEALELRLSCTNLSMSACSLACRALSIVGGQFPWWAPMTGQPANLGTEAAQLDNGDTTWVKQLSKTALNCIYILWICSFGKINS